MRKTRIPKQVYRGTLLGVVFSVNKMLGLSVSKTMDLFGDTLTEGQKESIMAVCEANAKKVKAKTIEKAISILLENGFEDDVKEHGWMRDKSRKTTEQGRPVDALKCTNCQIWPQPHRVDGIGVYFVCPKCGTESKMYSRRQDALLDWNAMNTELKMQSGANPSDWGSDIASSRPVDRLAKRVGGGLVGVKPLKLTEGSHV